MIDNDHNDNFDDNHDDQNNGVNPAELTHQPKDLQLAGDHPLYHQLEV